MNFETTIFTPNSSSIPNLFTFSPFSCGLQIKQELENLFDIKGQETNQQLLNIENRGLDQSPNMNFLDFPSPISIQQPQNRINISNEIPTLELPIKIQKKKLDVPQKKNKINKIKEINVETLESVPIKKQTQCQMKIIEVGKSYIPKQTIFQSQF